MLPVMMEIQVTVMGVITCANLKVDLSDTEEVLPLLLLVELLLKEMGLLILPLLLNETMEILQLMMDVITMVMLSITIDESIIIHIKSMYETVSEQLEILEEMVEFMS